MGIVGKNGTGKTTFLKMLLGTESIDKGKIIVGETVVFGHFSQDLIKVNDDFKVIDVVKEVAEFIPLKKESSYQLHSFWSDFYSKVCTTIMFEN